MNDPLKITTTRRHFLKTAVAASALSGVKIPAVHAQGSDVINIALVGCGGRGTGAARNAMEESGPPINLVAMADVYQHKLDGSFNAISKALPNQTKVDDRKFIGFDAFKHAVDCLKKGDVVLLTTPLAFRAPHFAYAIEKGVNVFMEKP